MRNRKLKVVEAPRVKTREEKLNDCWETINRNVSHNIKSSKDKLDAWAVRFKEDPMNAFEWSSGTFTEAARGYASEEIAHYLKMGMQQGDEYVAPDKLQVLKEVRRLTYDSVLRSAKWPEHSTAQQHNLIHQELASQRAEWLERLDNAIKYVEKDDVAGS